MLSEPGPPSSQTPSEAAQHVSEQPEEAVFPEIEEDVIVTTASPAAKEPLPTKTPPPRPSAWLEYTWQLMIETVPPVTATPPPPDLAVFP
jgi:hypothetical protein